MGLSGQPFEQIRGETRFADAWFTRKKDDTALAALSLLPAPQQHLQLFLAANERRAASAQGFEPACDGAYPRHPPRRNGFTSPFKRSRAKRVAIEEAPHELPRTRRNQYRIGLSKRLQAGGKLDRFTQQPMPIHCRGRRGRRR